MADRALPLLAMCWFAGSSCSGGGRRRHRSSLTVLLDQVLSLASDRLPAEAVAELQALAAIFPAPVLARLRLEERSLRNRPARGKFGWWLLAGRSSLSYLVQTVSLNWRQIRNVYGVVTAILLVIAFLIAFIARMGW